MISIKGYIALINLAILLLGAGLFVGGFIAMHDNYVMRRDGRIALVTKWERVEQGGGPNAGKYSRIKASFKTESGVGLYTELSEPRHPEMLDDGSELYVQYLPDDPRVIRWKGEQEYVLMPMVSGVIVLLVGLGMRRLAMWYS